MAEQTQDASPPRDAETAPTADATAPTPAAARALATLAVIAAATGVALALLFAGAPSPWVARVELDARGLGLLRDLHGWAGHLLGVVAAAALAAAALGGAFRRPGWPLGLGLGVVTLLFVASGAALVGDQAALWGTAAVGAPVPPGVPAAAETADAARLRLWIGHVVLLPLAAAALGLAARWRRRR